MRRPWFKALPVDAAFFETAPLRLVGVFEVARPASEVWSDLTGDDALHWCRILDEMTWTSPRPFGAGTTRTVKSLRGTLLLHEHFFRWEEGRRKSFYVLESNVPLFKALAEDYLVEPAGESSCRFTWTIAAQPHAATRIASPVNRALLGTLFTDTRKHYGTS